MSEEEKKQQEKAPAEASQTPDDSPDDSQEASQESAPSPAGFDAQFPIVGIGASAGGVKALETFFAKMPPDCGMAFIVIQHLHQGYKSQMDSLLARQTRMKVVVAREGMAIEPNHIYLNLPEKDLLIQNGVLHLRGISKEGGASVSIDVLFQSLAVNMEQYAICVILSGASADGTQGAKAVKGQGGLVVVQDPAQAEYSRMPQSTIDAGLADMVLPLEKMPEELMRYIRHPFINGNRASGEEAVEPGEAESGAFPIGRMQMQKIIGMIRSHTGHDFSQYKENTVRRRIARRIALHHIKDLNEYLMLLRRDTDEVDHLFRDMTITVTQFFRDPEVYEQLKEKALKPMMENWENPDEIFRVWVAGCSTGEEAYTLAMVLLETMEELEKYLKIKIFASDIDQDAVRGARNGLYPKGVAADLSQERLRRFFTQKDDHYQVDSKIRDMAVFAEHNIIRDPPFSKIDLISCRNLLIYMNSDLQNRIFPLFHYALKPGGHLLLGSSETPGDSSRFFTPVDKKQKFYKRKEVEPIYFPDVSGSAGPFGNHSEPSDHRRRSGEAPKSDGEQEQQMVQSIFQEAILKRNTRPSVLIDHENRIHYIHGDVGRFLTFPEGPVRFDLTEMAVGELRYRLMHSLKDLRQRKRPLRLEKVYVQVKEDVFTADVVLTPLETPRTKGEQGWVLIEFQAHEPADEPDGAENLPEGDGRAPEEVGEKGSQEGTLRHMRQELQAAVEELETSNEELKSANEELQANNEELQSANEELESSKEELQSSNEELETVNSELFKKNQELMKAEDDMENLFGAIQNGVILLDDDLRVQRFSRTATEIFKLKDVDRGRRLSDISGDIRYPGLEEDAREVLDTLERKEITVEDSRGTVYQVRIAPYRSGVNVIEGVVMTFINITEIRMNEGRLRDARGFLEEIVDGMEEPVLLINGSNTVFRASPAFCEMFGVTAEAVFDHSLFGIMGGRLEIPDLKAFLAEKASAEKGSKKKEFQAEIPPNEPEEQKITIRARRIPSRGNHPGMVLLTFRKEG